MLSKPQRSSVSTLVLVTLFSLTLLSQPVPLIAATTSGSIVHLAWFYKPPSSGDRNTVISQFDNFILTHHDEQQRDLLRSQGVHTPFLAYIIFSMMQNPGSCTAQPWGNQVAFFPGDFCSISANHSDWFLLDKYGKRLSRGSFYFMDPGNSGWRAFTLSRLRTLRQQGWDGVFLDNVDGSLSRFERLGKRPAAYPEDARWQDATAGFLSYLASGSSWSSRNPLYANLTEKRSSTIWFRYLKYLTGAMEEGWAVNWSHGYYSPSKWESDMQRVEQTEALGKQMIAVAQGQRGDTQRQQFAFASYLLTAKGETSFRYANASNYGQAWVYPNYSRSLGTPLGPRRQVGGVWRRDFTHGSVQVNPYTHQSSITTR